MHLFVSFPPATSFCIFSDWKLQPRKKELDLINLITIIVVFYQISWITIIVIYFSGAHVTTNKDCYAEIALDLNFEKFKGAVSGLRNFFATGSSSKIMKNDFHFILKAFFVLTISVFSLLFGYV